MGFLTNNFIQSLLGKMIITHHCPKYPNIAKIEFTTQAKIEAW